MFKSAPLMAVILWNLLHCSVLSGLKCEEFLELDSCKVVSLHLVAE